MTPICWGGSSGESQQAPVQLTAKDSRKVFNGASSLTLYLMWNGVHVCGKQRVEVKHLRFPVAAVEAEVTYLQLAGVTVLISHQLLSHVDVLEQSNGKSGH